MAIPTETVYGLAANALDGKAVARIFEAKGRPQDNPLIVHIAALEQWDGLVSEIPPAARTLAERFWPGPLTIILPKSEQIPGRSQRRLPTVAVRFPSHPVARQVIRQGRRGLWLRLRPICPAAPAPPASAMSGRIWTAGWKRC